MKRILTSFALVAASVAFSQVSISGDTNDSPKATLDVKAINGKANGILVPRVTKAAADAMPNPENASAIEESTLIYVEGDTSANMTNYAENVKTPGFYYFKGGKWVAVAPGSAGAGAKVQAYDTLTATVEDDADFIIFTPTTGNSTLTLPPSVDGRKVCIFNNSNDDNLTVTPTPRGQNSSVFINSGSCFVSYDNVWYGVGFY